MIQHISPCGVCGDRLRPYLFAVACKMKLQTRCSLTIKLDKLDVRPHSLTVIHAGSAAGAYFERRGHGVIEKKNGSIHDNIIMNVFSRCWRPT